MIQNFQNCVIPEKVIEFLFIGFVSVTSNFSTKKLNMIL